MRQAIKDLKWLDKRLSSLVDLIPEIEKLASLDNAVVERNRALADLNDQIKQKGMDLLHEEVNQEKAGKTAKDIITEAHDEVKEIKKQAERGAGLIIATAKAEAAEARKKAEKDKDLAKKAEDEKRRELLRLNREVSDVTKNLESLKTELARLKGRF